MAILLPDESCEYDTTTFRPGALVHGRYEVISLLGHGTSGAVYKAIDTQSRRTVALKHTVMADDAARQAFAREAAVLAELKHPALPAITDYFLDDSGQFLVMQFVGGDDLAAILRRRKKSFPLHDVVHWTKLLLDVLAHLHSQQPPIVHGDIKPGNLKPTESGDLMLLDFELSKDAMGAARAATGRSLAGHTARYSAPEWVEGKRADARTDLYALGATIYHLLSGAPPASVEERERAERIGQPDPVQSLDKLNPSVPHAVSTAVARAMALDPASRFATAEEMGAGLWGGEGADSALVVLASQHRRVDAAAPSWVSAGDSFDVFVQSRFFDSPRLGREDWPVEHRAADVERMPDVARLVFRASPWANGVGAATLVVRLVAPDFVLEGASEQLLEVAPDDYSPRVQFRLRTSKTGACRIVAELYTQDGVGVGAIPVDIRVGGELARPPLRVGHLMLKVAARADAAPAAGPVAHAPVASRPSAPPMPERAEPRVRAPFESTLAEAELETATLSSDDGDGPAWRWRDVLLAVLALVVAVFILSYVASSVRKSAQPQTNPVQPVHAPATTPPGR